MFLPTPRIKSTFLAQSGPCSPLSCTHTLIQCFQAVMVGFPLHRLQDPSALLQVAVWLMLSLPLRFVISSDVATSTSPLVTTIL